MRNAHSENYLSQLTKDHDRPRRFFPLTKKRVSRVCNECGGRFIAEGAFQRSCQRCQNATGSSKSAV